MDTPRGEIIFTTVHGSRLYGLDHEWSDKDSMIVYNSGRRAVHKKNGEEDIIHVGIYDLIEKAQSGAHQYVEGIMSPYKAWHDDSWKTYIEGLRLPAGQISEKYERTIKKLSFEDTFKLRRHAARLWVNLTELRNSANGRFDPHMDIIMKNYISWIAKEHEGKDLKEFFFPSG